MKRSDIFPSNWLNADQIGDDELVVTISADNPLEFEDFKKQGGAGVDRKPYLSFDKPRGTKPLILNKTNFDKIALLLGSDDSDDWAGRSVCLYTVEVAVGTELKRGIRVKAAKKVAKPAPPPPVDEEEDDADLL